MRANVHMWTHEDWPKDMLGGAQSKYSLWCIKPRRSVLPVPCCPSARGTGLISPKSPGFSLPAQPLPLGSIPVGECRPASACHIHCPGRAETQRHTGTRKENRKNLSDRGLLAVPVDQVCGLGVSLDVHGAVRPNKTSHLGKFLLAH